MRYSEVDEHGYLTVDALVNYLQDCTMLHSETVNHGIRHLMQTGEFWFLTSWQIDIIRTPMLYETIKVITNPYEFKGFFGSRNFWIEDAKGDIIVKANSVWVYLDFASQRPKRIPPEEGAAYSPLGDKLDMDYAPRKIKIPENVTEYPPMPVRHDQIDTNHHVNNCQYIKAVMDAAGIEKMPRQIRAEYKKAAVMGDVFHPYISINDEQCTADLRGSDGTAYAAVEFVF